MELAISCGWLVTAVCLLVRAFRQRDALREVTACEPPDPALAASGELRAARTIRGIDPVGYCGALITHPFALALLGAAFGSADALFLALLALGCRGVLCLCVEHTFGLTRQNYHLIPVRDLLSFAVHVTGLLGKSVSWRGSTYSVDWGGRIISGRN